MSNNNYPDSEKEHIQSRKKSGGDAFIEDSTSDTNPDSTSPQGDEETKVPDTTNDNDAHTLTGDEPSEILSEAERILDERNSYLDSLQRLQADFDNFRKRAQRQQLESKELATFALMEKLLPVLDAFELAMNHLEQETLAKDKSEDDPKAPAESEIGAVPSDETAVDGEFLKSFVQIGALLENILQKEGLTKIGRPGEQFNPAYHDAVSHEPAENPEEAGVIAEVLRSGYQLKERVIRPAMVKVKG